MVQSHDPRFPEPSRTGTVPFRGHETWYRVTGDLGGDRTPLVVLHGGPGAAHNYTLMMANLAADGRAVIHYDQLGCGESTHLPDVPADFWTVDLFVEELRTLVDHLGIDSFHLLGQSWGGMLAPEVVLSDSSGIRSLTICDSPASMELWLRAANELRDQLPADVQQTLLRHEQAGTTDDPEYARAMQVFYDRHVCRVVPNPVEVSDTFAQIEAEPTVYHTMNGPSEFHVIGSLKDWTIVDRLSGIELPTLVVAGAYDEARPYVWQPFVDKINGARSHVFTESSHMPHVEEPEEFLAVVGNFLSEND
ncbi:amino acid amidase [Microlunatus endophyticus]|uniref:Proline iminopeptidase n=1 Tax=Microlunatus endophyticus TaxID=1716077 RepID=A0A917SJY3_9ACTN|nr:proline iminopeptidase-family hydrolase [Microlunatus endophyticus]GGL83039.1 amino acid amidase [Microlunatus endophyticus]